MPAEVEAVLQSYQICPFRHRRAVPRAGAGGTHSHLIGTSAAERLAQKRFGHGAAAGVAGADEEDVHQGKIIGGEPGKRGGKIALMVRAYQLPAAALPAVSLLHEPSAP